MKLVVVSDNHGNTHYMEEIYSIHQPDTAEWIHCGDSELMEDHPLWQTYKTVLGNMDITDKYKVSRVEQVGEFRYLLVHGHKHGVKRSYDQLAELAKTSDVKVVFYGHTHIPKVEKKEGIVFINPGSIAQPRDRDKGTYLVMEIDGTLSKAVLTYYDQDHNVIHDLSISVSLMD
ncbi:metallophosphoesterase family protein [Alkalibacterium sp. f15]|uniref:metallophosphoesterase family protein n=1 Tax=Alkalibacterium sp. f15 TaxID=3414029 RepID=UPI003BF890B5